MTDEPFLAVDIGATSGRAVLGRFGDGRLELTEIHRFENHAVRLKDALYWDFLRIWDNIVEALSRCAAAGSPRLAGIGVDSWNLDFGLIDKAGTLLANPLSYRDQGAGEAASEIAERVGAQGLYEATGMPVYPITGLARLLQLRRGPTGGLLDLARWYLPIPDLVRYYLTGKVSIEETIAWGTQLMDVRTRAWHRRLFQEFAIPVNLFPRVVASGTVSGALSPSIAAAAGLAPCPVIAVAEHDTLSAAFAARILDPEAAILSVGTWSIFGCMTQAPITTPEARELGFMNELAHQGTFLAKNTMGFYILEELIRAWRSMGIPCGYQDLSERARAAEPGGLSIDPNDPVLFSPPSMHQALREHWTRTGQEATDDVGTVVRALYEGLAASYATGPQELARLTGRSSERIVMVGGGVRSPWFCQLVADACRVEVLGGPAEATVVGNLCAQALAVGRVHRGNLRSILQESFPIRRFVASRTD